MCVCVYIKEEKLLNFCLYVNEYTKKYIWIQREGSEGYDVPPGKIVPAGLGLGFVRGEQGSSAWGLILRPETYATCTLKRTRCTCECSTTEPSSHFNPHKLTLFNKHAIIFLYNLYLHRVGWSLVYINKIGENKTKTKVKIQITYSFSNMS